MIASIAQPKANAAGQWFRPLGAVLWWEIRRYMARPSQFIMAAAAFILMIVLLRNVHGGGGGKNS